MLGQVFHHIAGILVQQRVVLHDEEAVVVLLQDGHELEDGKCAAHIHFSDVTIQSAEDAGVVSAGEEDLVALQVEVWLFRASASISTGATKTLNVGGTEFDFP